MTTDAPESPVLRHSALRNGWILTQRALLHWVRQPATPIFGLLFSIMLLLMFGLLFGGAIDLPGGGDYISFLLPGMFTLSMLFGLDATLTAMSTDASRGITERFRSMPIGGSAVVLGRGGADLANSVLDLAVLMVGGLFIGWRLDADFGSVLLAVLLLIWLRIGLLCIGIFLGLALTGSGAAMIVQVLVWPIGFLSNIFVAPETMPAWLGPIAEWNPISATATAVRELFGNTLGSTGGFVTENAILLAALWPLLMTVIFLPLAANAYRRLRR